MRIEFVAADMDANGDSTGPNEGFFRVYTGERGQGSGCAAIGRARVTRSRRRETCSTAATGTRTQSADDLKFFPFATHAHPGGGPTFTNTWFDTVHGGGHWPAA